MLASGTAVAGKADQSGADRRPLGLGHSDGAEIHWADVGADGHWWVPLVLLNYKG